MSQPGQIVILNGAPRSGKSSIAAAIQETFDGVWMNRGVDVHVRHIRPPRYRPGIGLRPGSDRPEVAALVPTLYAALYDSIPAHTRLGLNVVAYVGHSQAAPGSGGVLTDCARRLAGLPVLFVGVRCPLEFIMQRRIAGQAGRETDYLRGLPTEPIPEPVRRWQVEVHIPGVYDLEVDTSKLRPAQCAVLILERLSVEGPGQTAFEHLA